MDAGQPPVATAIDGHLQRDVAAAVGIEDATLTHHLNRMERADLVTRRREPANRRNQLVELTPDGEELFARMLATVQAFDRRLRTGVTGEELGQLRTLLHRLRTNAATGG